MNIPEVWISFGMFLHQDFISMYPDFFSGVIEFAQGLSPADRYEFKAFISEIVSGDLNKKELYELWEKSGSQLRVDNLPEMFVGIDNALKKIN
ncbi:hypothetical protein FKG94_12830 [Exilibacterium tricleocarpae]|uniref:CdiI immunity protein domain-containing protein n=1 Tax=Exilibacterium tricleocarpae TaxID=2591008 RepID=A0A545TNU7_9GAMM|nr:hypothetical protein [Exilibacterium tricleocarpae]TQV78895.1 hypothetical protein FKG94_12830 [Exilibacterium tricleocarpae]